MQQMPIGCGEMSAHEIRLVKLQNVEINHAQNDLLATRARRIFAITVPSSIGICHLIQKERNQQFQKKSKLDDGGGGWGGIPFSPFCLQNCE